MPKQRLGPLQRELVRALRDPAFTQCRGLMFRWNEELKQYDNCCLGVACRVAEANGARLRYEEGVQGCLVNSIRGYLPERVRVLLRFREAGGRFFSGPRRFARGVYTSLAMANDCGVTFAEIADFIEANPSEVFEGPA